MRGALLSLGLSVALFVSAGSASACGDETPCAIEGGHYFVKLPEGWDGKRPLPLLIHFHGFREEAGEVIRRADIRAAIAPLDVALVVPQGRDMRWSGPDAPPGGRDDLAFFDAVLADLKQRWPINPHDITASGFSNGASFVWSLACHRSQTISMFLPIAGTFWVPEPEGCPAVPGRLMHIHGITDRQVPLEGRALRGGTIRQGDVLKSYARLFEANRCRARKAVRRDALICEDAMACAEGQASLCFHPGGHDFDPSWIGLGREWGRAGRKH